LALLFGADDLDVRAANGLNYGGGSSAFISIANAATIMTSDAPSRAAPLSNSGGTLSELFSRGGWLGGFAAGFLGSGVLGVLFGRGLIRIGRSGIVCRVTVPDCAAGHVVPADLDTVAWQSHGRRCGAIASAIGGSVFALAR